MIEKNTIIIFGCGGHSRSVTDVILLNDATANLIFVDENARDGEKIYGFDVVKRPPGGICSYFLGIGDNLNRKKKLEEIGERNLISVISSKSHLGFNSKLDIGCFVGNYSHVGPEATIGINTIINTGAIIEHEVKVGSHSHIGPNATISGRCNVGDLVFVGVGATVKDYVNICSNVIIGAGATVVKDITEPGTYVGTPVAKIK